LTQPSVPTKVCAAADKQFASLDLIAARHRFSACFGDHDRRYTAPSRVAACRSLVNPDSC
jgi:hypothetical protein